MNVVDWANAGFEDDNIVQNELDDLRRQRDDRAELEERLSYILRDALTRRLTEDEVRWLCAGCGIDVRSVT